MSNIITARGELKIALRVGEDLLKKTIREASLKSLWVFLTEVLFHPKWQCDGKRCCEKKRTFYEPLHRAWCDWAQDDSIRRKGLLAPRGHFKSTVISYGKAVHAILRDPNTRVLIVSAKEDNAINFAKQVKLSFQYNERMRLVFPEYCVDPGKQFGKEEQFITPARTDYTLAAPTLYSTYIDASLASQHYDLIIFDDPIEAKHVSTEEQASKARGSYNKAVPLLDPGGSIIVVGTRWAYYDLYSTMITESQGGIADTTPYKWIVRAALEKDGKPDFEAGEPIFPTRFPRSVLLDLLEEAKLDPDKGEQFWWNQYMNRCRAPGQEPFLPDWFIEIPMEMSPPLFGKAIAIDTALKDDTKKGRTGDYTVAWVGGWDKEGRLYLMPDGIRSNSMRSKEFLQQIVAMSQRWQAPTVIKQKVGEDTFGTQLRDAFSEVRSPLDYRPLTINNMGRKELRIKEALQAPMARREVFFVRREIKGKQESHPLLTALKNELVNLGQYSCDDAADALANFYHPEVKVPKQNILGFQQWKVPGAPAQLGGFTGSRSWAVPRSKGAGWVD